MYTAISLTFLVKIEFCFFAISDISFALLLANNYFSTNTFSGSSPENKILLASFPGLTPVKTPQEGSDTSKACLSTESIAIFAQRAHSPRSAFVFRCRLLESLSEDIFPQIQQGSIRERRLRGNLIQGRCWLHVG